jgi:phage shock protein PspC (stress-responsive transcriptional regulator)
VPPPPGSAFVARYGLVRPREGRYLAGVCAAIGRATNTDPVLWRVLLAVTSFFGIGILVYLAGWLAMPAEGDTASPIESLIGRGRSSTSPVLTILVGVLGLVLVAFIVTDGFRAALLIAAVLIGGILLANKNQGSNQQAAAAGGYRPGAPPPPYPPYNPGAPYATSAAYPAGAPYPSSTPYAASTPPAPSSGYPATTGYPGASTAAQAASAPPASAPYYGSTGTQPTYPPSTGYPAGGSYPSGAAYQPSYGPSTPYPNAPFAPRGPYAGAGQAYPPYLPPPAAKPKPPKPPRQRSALGAITLSLVLLALGVVAILDLSGGLRIPTAGYFAAMLGTVGLGLLVGTWFGRARWLIALGMVLVAALTVATGADRANQMGNVGANITWQPATYSEIRDSYDSSFGTATLDLSNVDFTGQDRTVAVKVNAGDLEIVLPPNVDVDVQADVNAGDAQVFNSRWGGFNADAQQITDNGVDGPGGGHLRLDITVNAGTLGVHR